MKFIFEPLTPWIDPITAPRPYCRFRAGYDDTLRILEIEAYELDAEQIVVQVDVSRAELRLDGKLRQNVRPVFPGIRVSFESRYGPLTYATDRFDDWRDNLRAIALSLTALRAVDRYGVNKRGEQYTVPAPSSVDVDDSPHGAVYDDDQTDELAAAEPEIEPEPVEALSPVIASWVTGLHRRKRGDQLMDEHGECTAEFVDGSYDAEGCGCEDCCEDLHDEVERQAETGNLSDAAARAAHDNLEARGY